MRNHAKTISTSVAAFCFLVLVITLAVGSADSAIEVKSVSSSIRMFSQQAGPVAPQWQVVKSDGQFLEVTFRLPGLAIQSVLADERQWQHWKFLAQPCTAAPESQGCLFSVIWWLFLPEWLLR